MSKKDHQKHPDKKAATADPATEREIERNMSSGTTNIGAQEARQPGATATESMGSEARIQKLEAEAAALQDALKRETGRADAAEREAKEWAALAGEVKQEAEQSASFRADLVALDELACGTSPNLPVTTEMGQRARKSIQELLRVIDMRKQQALEDAAAMGALAPLADVLGKPAKGAEVRGVLVHGIPNQESAAPGYDRVGGLYEVVKLTLKPGAPGGVEVEKVRELHDGKAGTVMAWHMARDHAEKILQAHVVPADHR
jgi:hypothetical protein